MSDLQIEKIEAVGETVFGYYLTRDDECVSPPLQTAEDAATWQIEHYADLHYIDQALLLNLNIQEWDEFINSVSPPSAVLLDAGEAMALKRIMREINPSEPIAPRDNELIGKLLRIAEDTTSSSDGGISFLQEKFLTRRMEIAGAISRQEVRIKITRDTVAQVRRCIGKLKSGRNLSNEEALVVSDLTGFLESLGAGIARVLEETEEREAGDFEGDVFDSDRLNSLFDKVYVGRAHLQRDPELAAVAEEGLLLAAPLHNAQIVLAGEYLDRYLRFVAEYCRPDWRYTVEACLKDPH